jgi:hypothetical protein
MKLIYTVIPFFYESTEIFGTAVKSFTDYWEAYDYATKEINGRSFEIIENPLDYNEFEQ